MEVAVTRLTLPPTLGNYVVPREVLEATQAVLFARGLKGVEAVVVWVGRVLNETTGEIVDAYVPEQVARRSEYGVSVEVTQAGLTRLIGSLEPGTFVLCRVHSHPSEAYHSDLDDLNMLISHQGAISIVVPDFARGPLTLEDCSVNELLHGRGWRELSRASISERFRIVG
jgi:hypothetical protein